jgi:hypothetical protein
MGFDELDDLLDGDDELEAAFRELDAQLKMEEMRQKSGASRGKSTSRKTSGGAKKKKSTRKNPTADPLKDLKSAFDGKKGATTKRAKTRKGPVKRYLVVVCPECAAKNRVPLERLRKKLPVCGRCKVDLSFER